LFDRRLTLGATYFHNRITDYIAFNTRVFPFTLANIGVNEAQGVELTMRADPTRWASVSASYTLTDSNIVSSATPADNGLQLVRRPRNAASLNVTLRPVEQARINLGLVYNGTMQDNFFGATGGRRTLAPYTLARIAVSYRVTPQVELIARVENAFNQTYEEIYGFRAPRRGAYGGLRVSF
jgi:vitamin B12 transporter